MRGSSTQRAGTPRGLRLVVAVVATIALMISILGVAATSRGVAGAVVGSPDQVITAQAQLGDPECEDDVFEENDDLANATTLAVPASFDAVSCDAYDVYRFPAEASDLIQIDLRRDSNDSFLFASIDLYRPGVTDLVGISATSAFLGDDDGTIEFAADDTGDWTIVVLNSDTTSFDYSLTIRVEPSCDHDLDDAYEPNDTRETATRLEGLANPTALKLCARDSDWFAVFLEPGETIEVLVELPDSEPTNSVNLDYWFEGDYVGFSDSTSTNSVSAGTVAPSAGLFTLSARLISAYEGGLIPYDYVLSYVVSPVPSCHGQEVTVNLSLGESPTDGDDVILGTPFYDVIAAGGGDDIICGLTGSDTIWGQDGDDIIYGGEGDDKLRGGTGNDQIYGEAGSDDLSGASGDDVVDGGSGDDTSIRGGTGEDQVSGGEGNDAIVSGNGGRDIVNGNDGDDKVTGGPRPDEVHGGDGADEVKGNKGADILTGGPGDDDLRGGPQPDQLDGGTGTDFCSGGTTGAPALENDTATNCETATAIP